MDHYFGDVSKNSLCNQGHKDIFSCVFFKSVTVFCFTFRSMMHTELIFGLKCEI